MGGQAKRELRALQGDMVIQVRRDHPARRVPHQQLQDPQVTRVQQVPRARRALQAQRAPRDQRVLQAQQAPRV
jgi:hypothetical protein